MTKNRLLIEAREAQKLNDPDITLIPNERNLYEWKAVIKGPADTPYEGGKWQLNIKCRRTYPIDPPSITFVTKVFHPNVNFSTGELCMDILKSNWSPAWTLQSLCRAIIFLFSEPNADSPLNCDAGNLIRSGDLRGFKSMAKMYTVENAMGNDL